MKSEIVKLSLNGSQNDTEQVNQERMQEKHKVV